MLCWVNSVLAQDSTAKQEKQIRLCYVVDQTYNFSDKLLKDYAARRMTLGLTFSDKKQKFAASLGLGFKGFKINAYNPRFTNEFLSDVLTNYLPVSSFGLDSLTGASLYNLANEVDNNRYYLFGTYSAHATLRFVYMASRFKPLINYSIAVESFVFYTPLLYYADPTALDPKESVSMASVYNEFSIGFNPLPLKTWMKKSWYFSLQVGYKFVKYKPMSFDSIEMNQFLPTSMLTRYENTQKLTISLSCYFEIFKN
jgi:hypothetical protein